MKLKIFCFAFVLIINLTTYAQNNLEKKIDSDIRKLVESYQDYFSNITGALEDSSNDGYAASYIYKTNFSFVNSSDNTVICKVPEGSEGWDAVYDSEWKYETKIYSNNKIDCFQFSNILEKILDKMVFSFGKLKKIKDSDSMIEVNYIYPYDSFNGEYSDELDDLRIGFNIDMDDDGKDFLKLVVDNQASQY